VLAALHENPHKRALTASILDAAGFLRGGGSSKPTREELLVKAREKAERTAVGKVPLWTQAV